MDSFIKNSNLGKIVGSYKNQYDPKLLFPIPRDTARKTLGLKPEKKYFYGWDLWNCYEFCWLDENFAPNIAILEILIPSSSQYVVESKSLKLYLNSFSNTVFSKEQNVGDILLQDLQKLVNSDKIQIFLRPMEASAPLIKNMAGQNIDHLAQSIDFKDCEQLDNDLLKIDSEHFKNHKTISGKITQKFHTNFLKSNCPVTNQPDWASVMVNYTASKKIDLQSFLKYIVSFKNHNEFHESCTERIFIDLQNLLNPEFLEVYARFTRRGGIDINPFRSSQKTIFHPAENYRTYRQ